MSRPSSRVPALGPPRRKLLRPWFLSAVFSPLAPEQGARSGADRPRGRYPDHRSHHGHRAAPEPSRPVVRGASAAACAAIWGRLIGFPLLLLAQDSFTIIVLVGAGVGCAGGGHSRQRSRHDQCGAALSGPQLRAVAGLRSISFFIANIVGGYLIGTFGAERGAGGLDPHPDPRHCRDACGHSPRSLEVPAAAVKRLRLRQRCRRSCGS